MSNADIFDSNGKIDPFYLPAGTGTVPTLGAVLTAGNSTGGQLIESSTGSMNLNTLNVLQIAPLDVLIEPAIGIQGDLSLPDLATITFEGDGNLVAQGALTLSKAVGESLKIENVDNAPSAIPNVLAYDETTGNVYYQAAGTSGTSVNSVSNSDGSVTVAPTTGNVVVSLPAVGSAGTYAYPASITTDAKGRISSITAGALPNISTVLTTGPNAGDASGNNLTGVGNLTISSIGASATSIALTATVAGSGTQDIQGINIVSAHEFHVKNTDGGSDATFNMNTNVLDITADVANLILTKQLEVNGASGNATQVLTSQGLNLPPVWADIPVQSPETLAQILTAGNSAGSNNINMNNNNITNVAKVQNGLTTLSLGASDSIVIQTDGVTRFNNAVNMNTNNINNVTAIAGTATQPLYITPGLGQTISLNDSTGANILQVSGTDVNILKPLSMNNNNITGVSTIQGTTINITGNTATTTASTRVNLNTPEVNFNLGTDANISFTENGLSAPNGFAVQTATGDLQFLTNDNIFNVEAGNIYLNASSTLSISTTQALRVNGFPGANSYVLTSQGPGLPPVWAPPASTVPVGGETVIVGSTSGALQDTRLVFNNTSGVLI